MTGAIPALGADTALDQQAARKAAMGFEALMIEKMLAAARPSETGPAADARSLADRALAEELARCAPFGFGALVGGSK